MSFVPLCFKIRSLYIHKAYYERMYSIIEWKFIQGYQKMKRRRSDPLTLLNGFPAVAGRQPSGDRYSARIESDWGSAWRLILWRIGDGTRFKAPRRVALLVLFEKEMANGQGEQMNGEEKKQYPIFGVPSQEQKNDGAHYQYFNFHHSSFIFECYDLNPKTLTLRELSAVFKVTLIIFVD